MENEMKFILASHGKFAISALETLEMIAGKQDKMIALGLEYGEGLDEFVQKYETILASMPECQVVILTDIYGGTPANAATQLLFDHNNIQIFSGFNIPLLLEVATKEFSTVAELRKVISENWSFYLTDINTKIQMRKEVEEDGY